MVRPLRCRECGQVVPTDSPIAELRAHLDTTVRRTAARAAKGEAYYIENTKKWSRWLRALDALIDRSGQLGE